MSFPSSVSNVTADFSAGWRNPEPLDNQSPHCSEVKAADVHKKTPAMDIASYDSLSLKQRKVSLYQNQTYLMSISTDHTYSAKPPANTLLDDNALSTPTQLLDTGHSSHIKEDDYDWLHIDNSILMDNSTIRRINQLIEESTKSREFTQIVSNYYTPANNAINEPYYLYLGKVLGTHVPDCPNLGKFLNQLSCGTRLPTFTTQSVVPNPSLPDLSVTTSECP
ncbi:hypothetical protein [Endozoicomonas sp.]|uniref:hypothetical protein n=1 Tax=Endozoicomonas sp. TaxID=1892382 RepID=UPI0028888F1A|nr:hypothetical protein [Endozoicomonas sp.]